MMINDERMTHEKMKTIMSGANSTVTTAVG
jgi:hypothetical protein